MKFKNVLETDTQLNMIAKEGNYVEAEIVRMQYDRKDAQGKYVVMLQLFELGIVDCNGENQGFVRFGKPQAKQLRDILDRFLAAPDIERVK